MTFKIGDRVEKWTGDYALTGEVRSVYTTKHGEIRYVIEPDHYGLQLIYSPHQLRGINNDTTRHVDDVGIAHPDNSDSPAATPAPAYTNARGEASKPMAVSEEEQHDRTELCTVMINGRAHILRVGAVISYADICTMAGKPADCTVVWSARTLNMPHANHGSILPEQNISACAGLHITAVRTGAA